MRPSMAAYAPGRRQYAVFATYFRFASSASI
jgi:hypothetical protein